MNWCQQAEEQGPAVRIPGFSASRTQKLPSVMSRFHRRAYPEWIKTVMLQPAEYSAERFRGSAVHKGATAVSVGLEPAASEMRGCCLNAYCGKAESDMLLDNGTE